MRTANRSWRGPGAPLQRIEARHRRESGREFQSRDRRFEEVYEGYGASARIA